MNANVVRCVAVIQVVLTCYMCLSEKPYTDVLLACVSDGVVVAIEINVSLVFPCLMLSLFLAYALQMHIELLAEIERGYSMTTAFDGAEDQDHPIVNISFWLACTLFTLLRNFLLLEKVDMFAVFLMSVVWLWSTYTACRPVSHPALICMRLVGIVGFVISGMFVFVLVNIGEESGTEKYLILTSLSIEGLLIVGHTWDYPEHSMKTTANCRGFYLVGLQVMVPLIIASNVGYI